MRFRKSRVERSPNRRPPPPPWVVLLIVCAGFATPDCGGGGAVSLDRLTMTPATLAFDWEGEGESAAGPAARLEFRSGQSGSPSATVATFELEPDAALRLEVAVLGEEGTVGVLELEGGGIQLSMSGGSSADLTVFVTSCVERAKVRVYRLTRAGSEGLERSAEEPQIIEVVRNPAPDPDPDPNPSTAVVADTGMTDSRSVFAFARFGEQDSDVGIVGNEGVRVFDPADGALRHAFAVPDAEHAECTFSDAGDYLLLLVGYLGGGGGMHPFFADTLLPYDNSTFPDIFPLADSATPLIPSRRLGPKLLWSRKDLTFRRLAAIGQLAGEDPPAFGTTHSWGLPNAVGGEPVNTAIDGAEGRVLIAYTDPSGDGPTNLLDRAIDEPNPATGFGLLLQLTPAIRKIEVANGRLFALTGDGLSLYVMERDAGGRFSKLAGIWDAPEEILDMEAAPATEGGEPQLLLLMEDHVELFGVLTDVDPTVRKRSLPLAVLPPTDLATLIRGGKPIYVVVSDATDKFAADLLDREQ